MNRHDVKVSEAAISAADWDALADELDAAPFTRRQWFESWCDAFATGPPRTLVAARDGHTVGVLPLRVRAGFLTSPTNWHTPEFHVLATDEEARSALLEAAVEAAGWQLELSFVDCATADLLCTVAQQAGRRPASRVIERSPYIAVDGSAEEYRSRLDRHALKEIARRRRRLTALGEVSVEVHAHTDGAALDEFYAVERAGWKGQRGTAVATDHEASQFYRSVAGWASARGWLRIAILRVGDRPVAADLSLEQGGRHYLLKTGYDEELRSYGPGKMLRLAMIERAFDEGLTSYEFLGSDAPWKAEWTSALRDRVRVQVFGPGPRGLAVEAAQVHGRRLVRSVREGVSRWRDRS